VKIPAKALELAVFAGDVVEIHSLPASGQVIFGRAPESDVRVDHPSVSRRHAALHLGPTLRLEDLGGRNGTFVGDPGERDESGRTATVVQLSRESMEINVGDCVTLGSTTLVVRRAPAPREAHEPLDLGGAAPASPEMRVILEQARLVARSFISVLILGETGVGKEVLARAIHRASTRADKPFLGLNCAALSESLLESELFGHEKGAFTGALQARPGLFEAADGGTVFLDEAGELPASVQVKLLRVLEDRKVLRVGARVPRPIDVRFLSATNRDLEAEVARGSFREDLYFRLNGIALTLPPLRRRTGEIAELARSFADEACRKLDRRRVPALSAEARALLEAYAWPGNIRELRNAVDRAVVLCQGELLLPEHFPGRIGSAARPAPARPSAAAAATVPPRKESDELARGDSVERLNTELDDLERRRVIRALERCEGNQTKAAALLGISRTTLVARIAQYGLPRPRKKA
jgi:transcriptional regulator with GAF, ATPase, and Fis domain